MFTQTADDAAVKAAQNVAQKSGGKTLSKFLSRLIPFANAALAGADAGNRVRQGDYFGAALGAATAIPGPAGWAALGGQMAYDAAGRPFMGGSCNYSYMLVVQVVHHSQLLMVMLFLEVIVQMPILSVNVVPMEA